VKASTARLVLRQGLLLVIAAMVSGLVVNYLRADGIPLIRQPVTASREGFDPLVRVADLQREGRVLFLDARPEGDYAAGHIAGAINVPLAEFDLRMDAVLPLIDAAETVVTYCDGEDCHLGEILAQKLREWGYANVEVLPNGWSRWQVAGLPVERGTGS